MSSKSSREHFSSCYQFSHFCILCFCNLFPHSQTQCWLQNWMFNYCKQHFRMQSQKTAKRGSTKPRSHHTSQRNCRPISGISLMMDLFTANESLNILTWNHVAFSSNARYNSPSAAWNAMGPLEFLAGSQRFTLCVLSWCTRSMLLWFIVEAIYSL